MNKLLQKLGILLIGIIIGILICTFWPKSKSVDIDKNDAPTKTAPAEKPPDSVTLEEVPIDVEGINKVEWLETELRQLGKDLAQAKQSYKELEDKKAEVARDTVWDNFGIKYQVSKAEFLFDDDLNEIKDYKNPGDFAIRLKIQANAFMPVKVFEVNEIEVKLDRIFAKHYMPDIEQDLYSHGVTGVLVGGATLASFLSKNPYLAGCGILLCTEFCFDILGVF